MPGPRNVSMASVRKLRPNKRNARTHSRKQIAQIAESIRRFGWTYPILVDENRTILAGHGRLEAANHLGLQQVPIIAITGLSEAEKRALSLADNKIAANAGWDRKLLATELGELAALLPECNLGVDITGFATSEIDALTGTKWNGPRFFGLRTAGEPSATDAAKEPRSQKTKPAKRNRSSVRASTEVARGAGNG
jgi:hypothetical protein